MAKTSHKYHPIDRNRIILIGAFIGLFVIILIVSLVIQISRIGKIATQVKYAPYSATISLNDTRIRNNSTTYLIPGSYHLKVESDHFESYEADINITEDSNYIMGILSATDEQGEKYMQDHRIQFTTVEGFVGRVLNEQGEKLQKKYPILKYLPIANSMYSITYSRETADAEPIINVSATDPEYLDVAAERILNFKGVEAEKLTFDFKNNEFSTDFSTSTATDAQKFAKESIAADSKYSFSTAESIDDEYSLVKISSRNYYGQSVGYYRVLLKKQGNSWKITGQPQPILTTKNNPDVPIEILKSANQK